MTVSIIEEMIQTGENKDLLTRLLRSNFKTK